MTVTDLAAVGIVINALKLAQLRFHADVVGMSLFHHMTCHCYILLKRQM